MKLKSMHIEKVSLNQKTFNVRLDRFGMKPVFVRNISVKLYEKVKDLSRTLHVSCQDKKEGEFDYVDVQSLNKLFQMQKLSSLAPYVLCTKRYPKILFCDENEHFDGSKCNSF